MNGGREFIRIYTKVWKWHSEQDLLLVKLSELQVILDDPASWISPFEKIPGVLEKKHGPDANICKSL